MVVSSKVLVQQQKMLYVKIWFVDRLPEDLKLCVMIYGEKKISNVRGYHIVQSFPGERSSISCRLQVANVDL